jgi:hypothetical protein
VLYKAPDLAEHNVALARMRLCERYRLVVVQTGMLNRRVWGLRSGEIAIHAPIGGIWTNHCEMEML